MLMLPERSEKRTVWKAFGEGQNERCLQHVARKVQMREHERCCRLQRLGQFGKEAGALVVAHGDVA